MKKYGLLLLILNLVFTVVFVDSNSLYSANTATTQSGRMYVPGLFLVKFEEQAGNIESSPIFSRVMTTYNVKKAERLFPNLKFDNSPKDKFRDLALVYRMRVSEGQNIEQICNRLKGSSGVQYAEPVFIEKVERIPNDPRYSGQQFLPQILGPEAWDIANGDTSVIIAIVDTGVDWMHPDLAPNIWRNQDEVEDGTDSDGNGYIDDVRGWDFVEGVTDYAEGEDFDVRDNNPMDFDGHGTHCAGLATAITDNEIGVASIGWGCTVMPLRAGWQAADRISGYLRMDWIAEALIYAANNGAHAFNISTGSSEAVADAGRYAYENGVVITKSAGNNDGPGLDPQESDPLELTPFTLVVASVDERDYKASYSSYGEWVTVSAPGGDQSNGRPGMLSTYPTRYSIFGGYNSIQGTSMAAPVVAGLAGLVKSHYPDWTPADIIMQIINTADNIDALNPAYAGKLGSGRINAFRALTEEPREVPHIKLLSTLVDDETTGNGNNIADIGEELAIVVNLENQLGDAKNVQANLILNDWAIEIVKGVSNLGDISGIRDLDNNMVDSSVDPFIIRIDPLALPHSVSGAIEIVADDYNTSYDITFAISPSILLVDDEELDNEKFYKAALDSLNLSYDYWDHSLNGTPPNMNGYSTVIWSCEWTFPSLDANDIARITEYLDNGGNFFLSGQDIGWDMNDPEGTTFLETNGASKTFYETYLHAKYVLDTSEFSNLVGVAGDPIGDGLSFNVFQPGRDAENQYPDEIEPLGFATSIFNYPNGSSGAIRYAGDYRIVYFGFGGYEAIIEDGTRFEVMKRVLDWLNSLEVAHKPLRDTEDTSNDYRVEVNVESNVHDIEIAQLLYDVDGQLPFSYKVDLTNLENNMYEGYIPAQAGGTEVIYSIFVRTANGYYSPPSIYNFYVGQDLVAPLIMNNGFVTTFKKKDLVVSDIQISDNTLLDVNSVYFFMNNGADSIKMAEGSEPGKFGGVIAGEFQFGDTLSYYIKARDAAQIPNYSMSDMKDVILGYEDFESGLGQWTTMPDGWGIENESRQGNYVSDSPGRNYLPGTNNILDLDVAFNLANADSATLSMKTKYRIQPGKTAGIVEISPDDGNMWVQVGSTITGIRPSWTTVQFSLRDFLGQENLLLRFRLEADATAGTNFDGWSIDDIRITELLSTDVEPAAVDRVVPQRYELAQNHPNPFNPETKISYQLAQTGKVTIKIYNALGQLVRTLVDAKMTSGDHFAIWDGKNDMGTQMSSGVYFYQMRSNDFVQTRKMLFLK